MKYYAPNKLTQMIPTTAGTYAFVAYEDHLAAISAARSEARREALEEGVAGLHSLIDERDKRTAYRYALDNAIAKLRALMEKDAPVRPTSYALDSAGLEAAVESYWEMPKDTLSGEAARRIVTAYLKAAKEVR